jgi:anti-sigma factor RsiW
MSDARAQEDESMCDYRERVIDYLYDEMPAGERPSLERHLEACDVCRDDVRSFRRVREDLLAWDVPEQTSVWTPFAPAPVVPWHRQVPAWAMAAAAGVMLMLGTAGGFAASALGGADRTAPMTATAAPAPQLAAPARDVAQIEPDQIRSIIRREMSNAGFDALRTATPVAVTAPMAARLDVATEQRLLANAESFVGASEARQWGRIQSYLRLVATEQNMDRRRDAESISSLATEVMELRETVKQLLAAQQVKVQ